jgi:serine/threonine protein kinase, bacterial
MTKKPYLGAILCALALVGGVELAAAGAYGALATSPEADFGFSYNFDDADGASARAMAECQKHSNDCKVKGTFQDTCVSIAKASNGAMGWAWGHGKRDDERIAMDECRKNNGSDCEISRRFCTGSP